MYKMTIVIFSVVQIAILTTIVTARQCPSSEDLCVPVQSCPSILDAIVSDRAKRNATLQEYIWSRVCHTVGTDREHRVCCHKDELPPGKSCRVASTGTPGKCVSAERCAPIAGYLQRNRRNAAAEKMLQENVCFRDRDKDRDYYCCPESMVLEGGDGGGNPDQQPIVDRSTVLKIQSAFPTCKDPAGSSGRCVPVRHCDHIHNAFLDDRIGQDRSLADFVRASVCPSDAKGGHSICCGKSRLPSSSPSSEFISHPKAARLGLENCGSVRLADKILQGSDTGPGQYPWMANLMYRRKGILRSLCSGSLIHPRYILTAAHCMKGSTWPVAVRLGEYDVRTDPDCAEGVCARKVMDYAVEEYIPNENFDGASADYDIALIRLTAEAILSEAEVYPVCLPLTESLLLLKPRKLKVTGWGLTESGDTSDVLLEADLQIVKRTNLCEGESTFCARGTNRAGHCQGDSGGPYQTVIPINASYKFVQFGVVSGGPGVCSVTDERPGVGVMVGYHIKWILDNMDI